MDNEVHDNITEPKQYDVILLAGQPVTGWERATKTWGTAWDILVYGVVAVNIGLLIWTSVNIALTCRLRRLLSRSYFVTLNVMVLIFAMSRILFYSIDPYSIRRIMPELPGNLLNNLTFPTLSVGFSLLYIALKQCVQPSNYLPILMKTRTTVIFSIACFLVSALTDIITFFVHSASLMIFVCQIFYILWAFVFVGLFASLIMKFKVLTRKARIKMNKSCYKAGHCRRDFHKRYLVALPACVRISCISSIFMLFLAAVNIYMVCAEFGLLKRSILTTMCLKVRRAWPFYILKTSELVIEHLLALTLVICGTQPVERLRIKKFSFTSTVTASDDRLSYIKPSHVTADLTSAASCASNTEENTNLNNTTSSPWVTFLRLDEE